MNRSGRLMGAMSTDRVQGNAFVESSDPTFRNCCIPSELDHPPSSSLLVQMIVGKALDRSTSPYSPEPEFLAMSKLGEFGLFFYGALSENVFLDLPQSV
jgi:hypothetical protein